MIVWPAKDADEEILYAINWADRLAGDAISSASFDVSSGDVTLSDAQHDGADISQVLVSAGTTGTKAKILCEIVTEDGQTLQQTATILVRAR
jgi:hypothetical protein